MPYFFRLVALDDDEEKIMSFNIEADSCVEAMAQAVEDIRDMGYEPVQYRKLDS